MDFKTIDKSNYRECMELQVEESQKYFVADNTRSLVEARLVTMLSPLISNEYSSAAPTAR